MIRVFIVDDHPMVVAGIKDMLQHASSVQVVGEAHDGYRALELLAHTEADVALLDINLPDLDGIALCRKLKSRQPALKIIGISTFRERSYITRMIAEGASGYLLKNASREELLRAIEQVHAGGMYMNMEVASVITRPASPSQLPPRLTSREKEVLQLIAEGFTNLEIAEKLFISPLTVDSHRKNLLAKFEAKNTAVLIKIAVELQLI
ncbi:MAG: DNA-binding response regulator [Bacteroidetes bacterium]|nr:MAG: DNA-binding response regulator [Bacteroidota bacterium]